MKNALLWLEASLQDQRMMVPQNYDGFVAHGTFPEEGEKGRGAGVCRRSPRGRCESGTRHLGE